MPDEIKQDEAGLKLIVNPHHIDYIPSEGIIACNKDGTSIIRGLKALSMNKKFAQMFEDKFCFEYFKDEFAAIQAEEGELQSEINSKMLQKKFVTGIFEQLNAICSKFKLPSDQDRKSSPEDIKKLSPIVALYDEIIQTCKPEDRKIVIKTLMQDSAGDICLNPAFIKQHSEASVFTNCIKKAWGDFYTHHAPTFKDSHPGCADFLDNWEKYDVRKIKNDDCYKEIDEYMQANMTTYEWPTAEEIEDITAQQPELITPIPQIHDDEVLHPEHDL